MALIAGSLTTNQYMMRTFISIILLAVGLFVLSFWAAGSHGHLQFRPNVPIDWILSGLLFVCFGIPIFLLIKWVIKRAQAK